MPPEGLEQFRKPSENAQFTAVGGMNFGTFGEDHASPDAGSPFDPDLAVVVAAWTDLPVALKTGILAMVKSAAIPRPTRRTC